MVLFHMGSDKTSSILMQAEDPVRQDMQFYYVVSGGITYSRMQMCTNAASEYMIMFYVQKVKNFDAVSAEVFIFSCTDTLSITQVPSY